jgi:hypothetical protein
LVANNASLNGRTISRGQAANSRASQGHNHDSQQQNDQHQTYECTRLEHDLTSKFGKDPLSGTQDEAVCRALPIPFANAQEPVRM